MMVPIYRKIRISKSCSGCEKLDLGVYYFELAIGYMRIYLSSLEDDPKESIRISNSSQSL